MIKDNNKTLYNGGKGSGNWGHKGRPGKIGGSGKGGNNPKRIKYGARLGTLARQVKARNSKMELLGKIKTAKNTSINKKKMTKTSKEINMPTITDKEMHDNLNMNMSDIYNYRYGYNLIISSTYNIIILQRCRNSNKYITSIFNCLYYRSNN